MLENEVNIDIKNLLFAQVARDSSCLKQIICIMVVSGVNFISRHDLTLSHRDHLPRFCAAGATVLHALQYNITVLVASMVYQ